MKYKIFFPIIFVLFILLLTSGTAFAAPVEIYTLSDLMAIDDSAANLSLDYILMNDINIGSKETVSFSPIGTAASPFRGKFNGNGHTISNITFSNPAMNYVGLFGYADHAEFSNITLKDIDMTGREGVGSLLGRGATVTIRSCSVDNSIVKGGNDVGSLVGSLMQTSSVFNSYATGTASGSTNVGGFVGGMSGLSSVSGSYATGDTTGDSNYVGGFVGGMSGTSSVSTSYATGNTTGNSNYVGGFVGGMSGTSSVFTSYATGDSKGVGNNIGGFVGGMDSITNISTSYATGNTTGDSNYVGGFVGSMSGGSSVSKSYATGNSKGIGNNIGGFVGGMNSLTSISESYATGTANGSTNVGGFIGDMNGMNPAIIGCFYIGVPNSNNVSKGVFVTSDKLKQISTFRVAGGYVLTDWSISSSPNPSSTWYIVGGSYPSLFYQSSSISPSRSGLSSVLNITDLLPDPQTDPQPDSQTNSTDTLGTSRSSGEESGGIVSDGIDESRLLSRSERKGLTGNSLLIREMKDNGLTIEDAIAPMSAGAVIVSASASSFLMMLSNLIDLFFDVTSKQARRLKFTFRMPAVSSFLTASSAFSLLFFFLGVCIIDMLLGNTVDASMDHGFLKPVAAYVPPLLVMTVVCIGGGLFLDEIMDFVLEKAGRRVNTKTGILDLITVNRKLNAVLAIFIFACAVGLVMLSIYLFDWSLI